MFGGEDAGGFPLHGRLNRSRQGFLTQWAGGRKDLNGPSGENQRGSKPAIRPAIP
jgi:hypothetical protein